MHRYPAADPSASPEPTRRSIPTVARIAVATVVAALLAISGLVLTTSPAGAAITTGNVTTGDNGTGGTLTINRPSGVATGQLLLAQVAVEGGSTVTIGAPLGWTQVVRTDRSGEGSIGQAVFRKVATALETSSYSFTFCTTTAGVCVPSTDKKAAGSVSVYGGVDAVTAVDGFSGATGATGTATAPSVTTTVAGGLLVAFYGVNAGSSISTPSGMTESSEHMNPSGRPTTSTDHEQLGAIGATGPRAATLAAMDKWVAQAVALRPDTTPVANLNRFSFSANSDGTGGVPDIAAGTSGTLYVRAIDSNNFLMTTYSGSPALTSNLGTTAGCGGTCSPTFTLSAFTGGTATLTYSAVKAESGRSFTVTDGSVASTSSAFAVTAGTAASLGLHVAAASLVADGADATTATATPYDTFGNVAAAPGAVTVSDSPDLVTIGSASGPTDGAYSFQVTASTVTGSTTLTAASGALTSTGRSLALGAGQLASFRFGSSPDGTGAITMNAGSPATVYVAALDANGNIITGFAPATAPTLSATFADPAGCGCTSSIAYADPTTPFTNGVAALVVTAYGASSTTFSITSGAVETTSSAVTPAAGSATGLRLTPQDPSLVADGVSTVDMVIAPLDQYGNVTTVDDAVTLTGGSIVSIGDVTGPTNGVYTSTVTAGTTLGSTTLTAAAGAFQAATDLTLVPGPLSSFRWAANADGTGDIDLVAGTPTTVYAIALDADDHVITDFDPSSLPMLSGDFTDPAGCGCTSSVVFADDAQPFVAGVAAVVVTAYGASATTLGIQSGAVSSTSGSFTPDPAAAARLLLSLDQASAVADGTSTVAATVTPVDAYGNTTTVADEVTLSEDGDLVDIGAASGPTSGAYGFTVTAGTVAGSTSLTAAAGSLSSSAAQLTLIPGPLAAFRWAANADGTGDIAIGAGAATTVYVVAVDEHGNVVTDFAPGTLPSLSGSFSDPAGCGCTSSIGFTDETTPFTNGVAAVSVTSYGAGSTTLSITSGSVSSSSPSFDVTPAPAVAFVVDADSGVLGTPIDVDVRAIDQFGNRATGYHGTFAVAATTDSGATGTTETCSPGDEGHLDIHHAVDFSVLGNHTVTVTDTTDSSITGSDTVVIGLATPQSLTASPLSGRSMELTWSAVPGATTYDIHQADSESGTPVLLGSSLPGGGLTETAAIGNLDPSTEYWFSVVATAGSDASAASASVSATTMTLLPAPTGVTLTAGRRAMTVSWDAVSGSAAYHVYRSTTAGGPYTYLSRVPGSALSYADLAVVRHQTYFYVVHSRDVAGLSEPSAEVSGELLLPPDAPVLSAEALSATRIRTSWSPVAEATSYNVYRLDETSTPVLLTNVSGATEYVDAKRTPETTSTYIVRAVSANGTSADSNQASATTMALPAAPTLTVVAPVATRTDLSWTEVTGATRYRVSVATTPGGPYTQIADLAAPALSYRHAALTPSTTYYYVVRSVTVAGVSAPSTEQSATTPALPDAPATISSRPVSSTKVDVTWSSVSGATSYRLYQATSAGGTYTQVASLTGTTYRVAGLTPSTTYHYVVRAVSSAGLSAASTSTSVSTPAA